ncbi:MAG: DUF87 domain-containing protein [Candidatus Nezhaarchaeales archaeon]
MEKDRSETSYAKAVGIIEGKTTTNSFRIKVLSSDVGKNSFLEVAHEGSYYVCGIKELYRTEDGVYAECFVIGQGPKLPFTPGSPVYIAREEHVRKALRLSDDPSTGIYVGKLKGLECRIWLPIKKLGRIFIVGKPGSGKSYTAGVFIEELLKKGIPLLVIDVHGEYSSLKVMGDVTSEEFDVYPKSYAENVVEFGNLKVNPGADLSLDILEAARPEDLIVPGQCTIINLRGLLKEEQISLVSFLLEKVFQAVMEGRLRPFYCVLDEAHRFAGRERTKATDVIRRFAQEGRKFGAGLVVITQRPQLLDTTVRGLVGTWVIHRLSDPNDMRITLESGGLESEWENVIAWLESGEAVITGEAVEKIPIIVRIRPRETKHGGEGFNPLDYAAKPSDTSVTKILEKLSKTVVRDLDKLQKQPISAVGLPQTFLPIVVDESEILTKIKGKLPNLNVDMVSLEINYMPALYCEVEARVERQNPYVKFSDSIQRLIPIGVEVGEINWDSSQAYGVELKDLESIELLPSPPQPGLYQKTCFNIADSKAVKKVKEELLAYTATKLVKTLYYSKKLGRFSLTSDRQAFLSECLKEIAEIEQNEERSLEESYLKSIAEIDKAIERYNERLRRLSEQYNILNYEYEQLREQLKEAKKQKKSILKLSKQLELRKNKIEAIRDEILKINTQIRTLNDKKRAIETEHKEKVRELRIKIDSLKKFDVKSLVIQPELEELSVNSFQLTWVPIYKAKVVIAGENTSKEIGVWWNALNGKGFYGSCVICDAEIRDLSNMAICEVCFNPMCTAHILECYACRARICAKDSWTCESCSRTLCLKEPPSRCKSCEALLCRECAKKCVACGGEIAYCSKHLKNCPVCGVTLCDEHFKTHVTKCSICSKTICEALSDRCSICNEPLCKTCSNICAECGKTICRRHSWRCKSCGRTFCINEEKKTCSVCGEDMCSSHSNFCELCGKVACKNHTYRCTSCGKLICKDCVGESKGFLRRKMLCVECASKES